MPFDFVNQWTSQRRWSPSLAQSPSGKHSTSGQFWASVAGQHWFNMEGECFVCHRYSKGHTGFNLNSTGLPLAWLPSHIEKGDTRLFLWQTHAGSPGSNTGRMHDWRGSQTRYQSAMSPSFWRVYHILSAGMPANKTRWNNDLLLLTQRLRRWSNIRTSLFQRVVFAGIPHI